MKDIEYETLINLVHVILCWGLAAVALVGVIFCGAWWHIVTAFFLFILGNTYYLDNEYGNESVKDWIIRKRARR